jgi:hypothetical protein
MIDSLSSYYNQASRKEKAFWAVTGATIVALGFTATSRASDPTQIPGAIHCEGTQNIEAAQGDTFSGLIDKHVSTNMSPSDLPHLVDGITEVDIMTNGNLPPEFVIVPTDIIAPAKQVSAEETYKLPKMCELTK